MRLSLLLRNRFSGQCKSRSALTGPKDFFYKGNISYAGMKGQAERQQNNKARFNIGARDKLPLSHWIKSVAATRSGAIFMENGMAVPSSLEVPASFSPQSSLPSGCCLKHPHLRSPVRCLSSQQRPSVILIVNDACKLLLP